MQTQNGRHDEGLARFVQQARRYPLLSAEEECDLARRWQDRGDRRALDRLLGSHLRLVIRIARGWSGYGLPSADLISEGNVGLMEAADRFDPDLGNRFSTYASWRIVAAIRRYVLRNSHMVRLGTTASQRKLFFNLRRLKAKHGDLGGGAISAQLAETIAEELDLPASAVIEMDGRIGQPDRSLSAPVSKETDTTLGDTFADEAPSPEEIVFEAHELDRRRALMPQAMATLDDREREILIERRLSEEPTTLQTLGDKYGVSRERVRQIELGALDKVRRAMCEQAA